MKFFFFFFFNYLCFLEKYIFSYEKKQFYTEKSFSLKRTYVKNIYFSFEKYIFIQKMYVLQIKI